MQINSGKRMLTASGVLCLSASHTKIQGLLHIVDVHALIARHSTWPFATCPYLVFSTDNFIRFCKPPNWINGNREEIGDNLQDIAIKEEIIELRRH